MKRNAKTTIVSCTIALSLCISSTALAQPSSYRISGDDRYKTAVQVSTEGWGRSTYAILATGEDFPDALCASPLAKKYDAPILLTEKQKLNPDTEKEIVRLGVHQVFIVGGEGAVSNDVEDKLTSMNIKCTRVSGMDRYETAVKVAEQLDFTGEVAVATGENFPDAISIASVAAQKGIPILLTNMDKLPESVEKYINGKDIKSSYIIGGDDVVSSKVAANFKKAERLSGIDRYETNLAVIDKFQMEYDFSTMYAATGENYPDALAASVLAAKNKSPLYLVGTYALEKTRSAVTSRMNGGTILKPVGGDDVVLEQDVMKLLQLSGNTNGNLQNDGFVAGQGEWDYYYLKGSFIGGHGVLYKIKGDGTGNTLLDTDNWNETRSNLNVIGDFIYYQSIITGVVGEDEVRHTDGIYKIKTDGTGKTKISNDNAEFLMSSGDWLYFSNQNDNYKIYRMKTDGSGKMKINDDASFRLNTDGNWIYYMNHSDNDKLYRMMMDGTKKEKLSDAMMDKVVVEGDYIYYITPYNSPVISICRMKIDGTDVRKLLDVDAPWIITFNIYNGNVYYTEWHDENGLINVDGLYCLPDSGLGSRRLMVSGHRMDSLWTTGSNLYFQNFMDNGAIELYKLDDGSDNAKLINRLQVY